MKLKDFLKELKNRLKGCMNILMDNHKFIGQPENNCPCYDKYGNMIGFWSRSNAVVVFVFAKDKEGDDCILVSQRGKGTPDVEFRGAWNVTCGYLDCDESLVRAASRETYEETGIILPNLKDIKLWYINDNPTEDKRQNVTFRFYVELPETTDFYEKQFSHIHNEQDEVDGIEFVKIDNLKTRRWAFNHDKLIPLAYAAMKSGKFLEY